MCRAFPGDAPFAWWMGLVFRVLEDGQRTQHRPPGSRLSISTSVGTHQLMGHAVVPSEAHTTASSSRIPSLWSSACLCFLFHACAGLPVCVGNQFKVHKKVAHLAPGTSNGQSPWLSSPLDH